MRKKLLFMLINMNVGGTEKALLNMVEEIPKEEYDITVLMLEKYGGFLGLIPNTVRIEYVPGYGEIKDLLNKPPKIVTLNLFKEGNIIKAFKIGLLYLITKIMKDRSPLFEYLAKDYPDINNEFDVAVAYDGPMDFISYFVLKKIKAKVKIQWIHFDITKIGFNKHFATRTYKKFDKIFVVSHEAKNKLVNLVPALKERTEVFSNVISSTLIRHQAKVGCGFSDQFDGIRILTVGRLTLEKGQDLAIRVLAMLIEAGYKVKWYCLGEGNERGNYEKLVEANNLKDKFVFLGADSNPYHYIEQCNLYVQPSRHEGYCIALAEARCLKKPIVTTDFAGAREQIKNGETGFIVSNNENEIYHAVTKLIDNHDLCLKFSANLAEDNFSPALQMTKIYRLLN